MVWVILPYYILWRFQHFCLKLQIILFDAYSILTNIRCLVTSNFFLYFKPLASFHFNREPSECVLSDEGIYKRIIFCWNLKRLVYKQRKTFVLLDISLKTLRMQTSVTAMMHFVFPPNVPLRCLAAVGIVRCSHNSIFI